jgi:hypothetical protein
MKEYYGVLSRKWEAIVIGRMKREIFIEFSHDEKVGRLVWQSYLINMPQILRIIKSDMCSKRKDVKRQQKNLGWENCRASGFAR